MGWPRRAAGPGRANQASLWGRECVSRAASFWQAIRHAKKNFLIISPRARPCTLPAQYLRSLARFLFLPLHLPCGSSPRALPRGWV